MTTQIAGYEVEWVQGPEEIRYRKDELIVLCLVRNGEPWVRTFVEHYFSLGAKHIVVLDNGSTDDTVSVASEFDDVTVIRTKLPFNLNVEGTAGQTLMRRYLVERFGNGGWSLCVDVDELFDYPYSDTIGLGSFLSYLNSKSYTAVTARMLDMFPEPPLSDRTHEQLETWKEEYRFYDISGVEQRRMRKQNGLLQRNVFDSDEVTVGFKGGVRETVFGFKLNLTKYPLRFSDGTLEHGGVHSVGNARIADLTCVLFHYKFYAFALQDYWHKAVQFKRGRSPASQRKYEQYVEVLKNNPNLQLKLETFREIASVNDLLENGFLVASEDYVHWVDSEEEKNIWQVNPQSKPNELTEALLESKRQERAKTLTMGRLERGLLEHRRQEQIKDQTIKKLKQQKRKQGRDISELEKKIVDQGQKIQRLRHRRQRLTKQNNRLRQQLANVEASRVWKLVQTLRHIKDRLKSRSWS